MLKRASKSLYEMMGTHDDAPEPRAAVKVPRSGPPLLEDEGWIAPGRSVRIPVGYLLLGTACLLAMLALAWMGGSRSTRTLMEAEYAGLLSEQSLSPLSAPLLASAAPVVASASSDGQDPGGFLASGAEPIESDPRQPGMYYFVLAETAREGSLRMATFCRAHGLEAYVVGSKNTRLRKVVTLPAVASRDRKAEDVRRLEAQIISVGSLWKRTGEYKDFQENYIIEHLP